MTDEASHIQKYPVERPSGEVRAVREVEQIEKELWALGPDLSAILPAEAATDAPE
jgi:hypothetical protein